MTAMWRKNPILRLGIILVLAGQFMSLAHASEFGTAPHDHNGYQCLAALTDDDDGFLPSANLRPLPRTFWTYAIEPPTASSPLLRPVHVRPPATGPPSI